VPVAFVLHAHLPWVRRNGTYPAGEQWLFEAWSESYLPLLDVLERQAAAGARDVLTLGLTPVLVEQMADPALLADFHGWLGRRLLDLEYTVSRYGASDRKRLRGVWSHHWRRQSALLEQVESRFLRTGLLAPFRALADAGVIELLGGPATHPCLALADDPRMVRRQIATGLAVHERHLGARPRGVWTPECAYRPAGTVIDPTGRPTGPGPDGVPLPARTARALPGLEDFWAEAGADHLVLDGPTLARGAGAGDRDWSAAAGALPPPGDVLDVLDAPVWIGDSDVAAFGRNLAVSYAVWSPLGGYPADPAYRDFSAVDLEGGFKSWRVTALDRWDKQPYEPVAASERAVAHAEEFVRLAARHLGPRPDGAVVVAAYDAELLGHWWYEGPRWLACVLDRLSGSRLRPTTLAAALERRPPARRLRLPESSWGSGKGFAPWVCDATRPLWTALRATEARVAALPADAPGRDVAWRQLALAQASDWPFLIARDQSARYAWERFLGHVERCERACRGEDLQALAARDDPWGSVAAAGGVTVA
jgi:1,4-alpha-glucan branching enzyme